MIGLHGILSLRSGQRGDERMGIMRAVPEGTGGNPEGTPEGTHREH